MLGGATDGGALDCGPEVVAKLRESRCFIRGRPIRYTTLVSGDSLRVSARGRQTPPAAPGGTPS
jgi:hypothetical protein